MIFRGSKYSRGRTLNVIDVTEGTYDNLISLSFDAPVVIEAWSEGSRPSKRLSRVLHQLVKKAADRWVFARIDVDANPWLARTLGVTFIPTVLVLHNGDRTLAFEGAPPKASVCEFVEIVIQIQAAS